MNYEYDTSQKTIAAKIHSDSFSIPNTLPTTNSATEFTEKKILNSSKKFKKIVNFSQKD